MTHHPAHDPRAAHLFDLLDGIELPKPVGWQILVLQYGSPEKVGSIYIPEKTKKEFEYSGRVGLILAMGADAYSDPVKFPAGPWCAVGDWIMWPAQESATTRFKYGRGASLAVLSLINDTSVVGLVPDPTFVPVHP